MLLAARSACAASVTKTRSNTADTTRLLHLHDLGRNGHFSPAAAVAAAVGAGIRVIGLKELLGGRVDG